VQGKRLTVCVTGLWAGWDSLWRWEKTRSQKNAWKCRRIPQIQCTLC